MPNTEIYPLISTGVGDSKQGKYVTWGYKDDAALIGRYYIPAIFDNNPNLTRGAERVLMDIILECANKKVGIIPIELSSARIMGFLKCDKYRASKVRKELLTAKLLLKKSNPVKGKGMMVILNNDLIEGYEREYLAKVHKK